MQDTGPVSRWVAESGEDRCVNVDSFLGQRVKECDKSTDRVRCHVGGQMKGWHIGAMVKSLPDATVWRSPGQLVRSCVTRTR